MILMKDCLFCKIIAGEIPCAKLFEDDNFFAFLDISPINEGHTLIIPKQHIQDFTDFPEELGNEWVTFTKKVIDALKSKLGVTDFNIGMNNGPYAGQVVFHQHTHLIPRKESDGFKHWPSKQATPEELKEVQKRILSSDF